MDTSLGTRHGTSDECYDPYCDSCYEGGGKNSKAYGFCTNCVQFLCTDCYNVHGQRPATRHHDVVYGEDMPKSQADKPPRFDSCEVHPKLLKDQFCCDHKTLLCSVCSASEHNTCFIKNVEKVCTIVDSSDTCALYDRISSLQETLKSTLPYVDKVMMELTDQEKTMLHDAQKVYDQIIEQANTSHVSIKNEIQTRCQSKISRLSHLREKVSDMRLNLDTPLTELKKIKTKPIDTKLFLKLQENVMYTQNIAKELQDLYGPLKIVSLSFIPSQSSQEMLHSSFTLGRIQKSESVPSGIDISVPDIMFPVSALKQTTANPNAGQRPPPQNPRGAMASPLLSKPTQPLPKMKVTKKGTFNIKLKDDLNTCCITGISISNDKRILMTDYDNSKVKMFSHDMKYLSSVSVPEKPRDIAVISDDEAVVTADRQSLVILDIRGSQPSIRTRTELSYDIRGICKRNNKLVVTSPGSNPASVKLIDQTGKVHWTVSCDPQGQSLFSLPWYVSSHGGERSSTVIVTDQSDDKVALLNVDAKEIIGRHLTMKSPFGVTSDSTGNVYVCYLGSDEVVLLSGDLSKQTILLSAQEGLKANPQAIAYDDDTHHLIVSYHSHDKVHRFKLS